MPHLVIGHTTETTAGIWVQGDELCPVCEITLQPPFSKTIAPMSLYADRDYIAKFDIAELEPDREYEVTARFSPGVVQLVHGRFRTVCEQRDNRPYSFSFVLSSCNLSVVSINNFLAFLVAAAGTSAAVSSLKSPPPVRFFKGAWVGRLFRVVIGWIVMAVAWVVNKVTGLKQPPPPYLRSPFLKLAAVFDSWVLEIRTHEQCLPAVGEVVVSARGKGVVASSAFRVGDGTLHEPFLWRIVLTQVEGDYAKDDEAYRQPVGLADRRIGPIVSACRGRPWYDRPAFFIHAGDQIYYDFPTEARPPKRKEYARDYREAWFDEDANRYLLSHYPHYMIFDDHEIADQFATDFTPPEGSAAPGKYLEEADAAYRQYVDIRHPTRADDRQRWYTFSQGHSRFFVLDTRTKRYDGPDGRGQIIDPKQLEQLLRWMTEHKDDLKFVVTSVPFVAEINAAEQEKAPKWSSERRSGEKANGTECAEETTEKPPRNPATDSWSAARFRYQRDAIIKHICKERIERLVFLTGDMHCCYHATMRIGRGKYESIAVHELAGGPMNQLQLANIAEFHVRRRDRACGEIPYEVVLAQFHSQVNGVMHLSVAYVAREQITGAGRAFKPEVEWNVIRTLTDNTANAWTPDPVPHASSVKRPRAESGPSGEPVMAGRIVFARQRTFDELMNWPAV